jgi:hypothetical protein
VIIGRLTDAVASLRATGGYVAHQFLWRDGNDRDVVKGRRTVTGDVQAFKSIYIFDIIPMLI